MAEIDRLTVVFDARFDKLEEKLNKAVRATYAASSKMEKNFDVANQNISAKLGRGFGTAIGQNIRGLAQQAGQATTVLEGFGAAGIVAAAGIGALVVAMAAGRKALAFADEIADSATKIGVTTDTLQEYRYAIHAVGGEAKDADSAIKSFTEILGQASSGLSPRALKAFKALGISKDQLNSFANADEALKVVIDRLASLGSEAQRQGAAAKLGLSPLVPLLRGGAEAAEELRQKAHDLGYVMGSDLANGAGAANDKLEDLEQILKVQLATTFVNLAPLILGVADALAKMAQAVANFSNDEATRQGFEMIGAISSGFAKGGMIGASRAAVAKGFEQSKRTRPQKALPADFGMDVDDPDRIRAAARAAAAKGKGTSLIDQSGAGHTPKAKAGPRDDTDQRIESINAALATAARDLLQAQLGLTEDIEARAEIERNIAREEATKVIAGLEKAKADLADDKGFKGDKDQQKAQIDLAIAAANIAATAKDEEISRRAALALEDRQIEVYQATIEAQISSLEAEAQIATTADARNKIEKRILDLRQQLERDLAGTQIDRRVRSGELTAGQGKALKDAQGVTQTAAQGQSAADHLTPMQEYIRSISDADTAMQNFAVHGVQQVTDALADAITGATSFKAAFSRVISSLLAEITRINLNGIVSGNAPNGGAFLSSLGSLFKGGGSGAGLSSFLQTAAASNPFLFANGTDSAPGGMSIVGERGPELLNLPRGAQVIPNDILRGLSRGGGSNSTSHNQTLHMHVYPTPGMSAAEARRTGSQIGAAASRRMAQARKQGF